MADKGQIGYSNNKKSFWLNEGIVSTIDISYFTESLAFTLKKKYKERTKNIKG